MVSCAGVFLPDFKPWFPGGFDETWGRWSPMIAGRDGMGMFSPAGGRSDQTMPWALQNAGGVRVFSVLLGSGEGSELIQIQASKAVLLPLWNDSTLRTGTDVTMQNRTGTTNWYKVVMGLSSIYRGSYRSLSGYEPASQVSSEKC